MKKEEFIYKDVDYLQSPNGWLEARLHNRLREGFEIWRDDKEMAWRGSKRTPNYWGKQNEKAEGY